SLMMPIQPHTNAHVAASNSIRFVISQEDGLSFSLRRRNEPLAEIYLSKIAADFFRKPPDVINSLEVTRYDSKRQYVWQNRMLSVTGCSFQLCPVVSENEIVRSFNVGGQEKGSLVSQPPLRRHFCP